MKDVACLHLIFDYLFVAFDLCRSCNLAEVALVNILGAPPNESTAISLGPRISTQTGDHFCWAITHQAIDHALSHHFLWRAITRAGNVLLTTTG